MADAESRADLARVQILDTDISRLKRELQSATNERNVILRRLGLKEEPDAAPVIVISDDEETVRTVVHTHSTTLHVVPDQKPPIELSTQEVESKASIRSRSSGADLQHERDSLEETKPKPTVSKRSPSLPVAAAAGYAVQDAAQLPSPAPSVDDFQQNVDVDSAASPPGMHPVRARSTVVKREPASSQRSLRQRLSPEFETLPMKALAHAEALPHAPRRPKMIVEVVIPQRRLPLRQPRYRSASVSSLSSLSSSEDGNIPDDDENVPASMLAPQPSGDSAADQPAASGRVKQEPTGDEELAQSLTGFLQPKVDIKVKEEHLLVEGAAETHIEDLTDFTVTLHPAIRDVGISRAYQSTVLGGNRQKTCPRPSKERQDAPDFHGGTNLMFLRGDLHPHAPGLAASNGTRIEDIIPGKPGLWCNTGDPYEWDDGPQHVWVRVSATSPVVWRYVGEYDLLSRPSLSTDEWKQQSPAYKNAWAKSLMEKGKWAKRTRVSVILHRDLGRTPTDHELETAVHSKDEYKNLTPAEIIRHFDKGLETMSIYALQCIGYDEDLQRKIAAEFPTWVPPPKVKTNNNSKGHAKKKGTRSRESEDSDNDGDDEKPTRSPNRKVKVEEGVSSVQPAAGKRKARYDDDTDYSPSKKAKTT